MKSKLLLLFVIFTYAATSAQEMEISGVVISSDDELPIPGVSVIIQGTTNGTSTDFDGNYSLNVNKGDILEFSALGMKAITVIIGDQAVMNIALDTDTQALDEVVVIGYGTVRKSDLTGSVSSVKGAEMVKIPFSSPTHALQGKMAGVQVSSNSGAPGSNPTVRIRGVGTLNDASPIFVVDGVILNDMSFVNANDIESIEVLKDASSTAIYGSRGANGVIIVTTKTGKSGEKVKVSFSTEYDVQYLQKYIDLLDGKEFATIVNQFNLSPGTFNNVNAVSNIDWQRRVFDNYAAIQNHQLSVSGGSEKSTYYVSAGYFNQDGIIPKSGFEKITFKINNRYQASKNFEFGHNITFNRFERDNAANVVPQVYRAWPTDVPFNDDGSFAAVRNSNPLASIAFNNNQTQGNRAVGNLYVEYKFLEGFTFKSSYGFDLTYEKGQSFTPIFFVSPLQQNDESRLTKGTSERKNWLWENTLNFNKEFDKHRIDAVVGYTSQEDNFEGFNISASNLFRDEILVIPEFPDEDNPNRVRNFAETTSLVSYLGRVNYTAFDKYLLTATFRADGSSKFAKDTRWGYFPSFALGWNIYEEPFFKNVNWIDKLKVRASWGIIGNEKVPFNSRFSLVDTNVGAVFGEGEVFLSGSTFDISGNPDLRWEETTTIDVGLEFSTLNNRLNFEFDYYDKNTNDILVDITVPGHLGNGSLARVTFNAAEVENTGFEFNANWNDTWGGLNYSISALGATVHNEVLGLGSDTGRDSFITLGNLGNGQLVKRIEKGFPIGYFYGFKVAGIFQNDDELSQFPRLPTQGVGDFRYEDTNGDGELTTEDRTFIGSPIPDFTYGFNIDLNYKNFNLGLDFQGEIGKEIYNGKKAIRFALLNFEDSVLDAWNGPGTSNTEPRLSLSNTNFLPSDAFVEDGSFFRLRNITLGYTFSDKVNSLLNIANANIYLRGTNIFTITDYSGYSPEIGNVSLGGNGERSNSDRTGIDSGIFPVTSVYALGLNLAF